MTRTRGRVREPRWPGWLPMGALLAAALGLGPYLPAWLWMWTLSVAVFAGFKWATLVQALTGGVRPVAAWRGPAYLFLWPGMDARGFLAGAAPSLPTARAWFLAALEDAGRRGRAVVRGAPPWRGTTHGLGGHGGDHLRAALRLLRSARALLAAARGRGLNRSCARRCARRRWANSGGKRWNFGFPRPGVRAVVRASAGTGFGARTAILTLFLFSGLVHDLVISLPARAGYGLPTAYFLLQGVGLLAEHVRGWPLARWRGRWQGQVWTWLVVAGPAFWLFHPPFVRGVILPFLRARSEPSDFPTGCHADHLRPPPRPRPLAGRSGAFLCAWREFSGARAPGLERGSAEADFLSTASSCMSTEGSPC